MARHESGNPHRGKTPLDIPRRTCRSRRTAGLGMAKCRQRAREVLFWPGMSVEIEQMVTKKQPSEQLKPSVPPSLPWKKIGTVLFEFRGEHYLLSVYYRCKFLEVAKLGIPGFCQRSWLSAYHHLIALPTR